MPNNYFAFKQFTVQQDRCAMKVTTDACLFGAWCCRQLQAITNITQVLDIGTGTGLLALMVAQNLDTKIDAVEIDSDAAAQGEENIVASPWAANVQVTHADIKSWQASVKYNCILANPPFYQNELKGPNPQKNKAHHDSSLKLNELLYSVDKFLAEDGRFYLMLPAKREAELMNRITPLFYLHQKVLIKQTPLHTPFRLFVEGGKTKSYEIAESNIVIKNTSQEYTPEFTDYMKDYYLHL